MLRPGYYVEGMYFRDKFHQARARAAYLARQYGRSVAVLHHNHSMQGSDESETPVVVLSVFNGKKQVTP